MKIQTIDPTLIDIPEDRVRAVTKTGLANLRQSIMERGIITPVIVRKVGKRYRLIVGAHRTTLAIELGMQVPANIRPEDDSELATVTDRLDEIDENAARGDLTQGERGVHMNERRKVVARKRVLEEASIEGGDGTERKRKSRAKAKARQSDLSQDSAPQSKSATTEFINDTAEATGRPRKSIKADLSRGLTIGWMSAMTGTDESLWCGPECGADNFEAYTNLTKLKSSHRAWSKAAEANTDWGKHAANMVKRIEGELKRTAKFQSENPDNIKPGTFKGMAEEYAYISQADYENRDAKARMERLNALAQRYRSGISDLRAAIAECRELRIPDVTSELRALESALDRANSIHVNIVKATENSINSEQDVMQHVIST